MNWLRPVYLPPTASIGGRAALVVYGTRGLPSYSVWIIY